VITYFFCYYVSHAEDDASNNRLLSGEYICEPLCYDIGRTRIGTSNNSAVPQESFAELLRRDTDRIEKGPQQFLYIL
jgi:hypothetical protein